mgnify:CR=1 FL=1
MISVPDIVKGRTGYLVMVDRFCRDGEALPHMRGRKIKRWNDPVPDWQPDKDGEYRNQYFYGGNLRGVTSKIDYLDKLGVDLVCLSPISKSNSYHHYDVHDQRVIDPYIGDWNDFAVLAKNLHKRGKILGVDLVFNHRSADSEFFKKALAGDERYRKWFEWDKEGKPVYWYGFKDMPQCNKLDHSYQDFCCEEAMMYVRNGADVIRLDLGENLPREFLIKIRTATRKINPNVVFVNEMWHSPLEKENPQIYDGQADSVMNYPLTDAILRWVRYGNYAHLEACMKKLAKYPIQVHDVLFNYLCTHDTPRERNMLAGEAMVEDPFKGFIWDIEQWWRTIFGFPTYDFRKWEWENDDKLSPIVNELQKLAVLILYLMKGNPIIFYGSEVELCGNKDPFCRKPFPTEKQNMDMLNYYIGLGMMRTSNKDILATGDMFVSGDSNVLEIIRRSANGVIVAFINRTGNHQKINAFYPGSREIFSLNGSNQSILNPYGAFVCRF